MSPVQVVRNHPQAAALAGATLLVLALVVPLRQSLVGSLAIPDVTVNMTGDVSDALVGDGLCDTDLVSTGEQCTLRAAVEEVNAGLGTVDTINFSIGGGGQQTITLDALNGALPPITESVTINGWTQPGHVDDPLIAIDGAGLGTLLDLDGGDSTVQGLALLNAGGAAIDVDGAGTSTVRGNWIGVDLDGVTPAGPVGDGIVVQPAATGTTIGGTGPNDGNVVANAGDDGIHVMAAATDVVGNLVGTAPDGTTAMGATADGVRVDAATGVAIEGGTIANNGGNGVTVVNGADDVAVVGTTISANTGLAIDLGDDGPTANDVGDTDLGDNGLLNHPTVEATGVASVDVEVDTDIAAGTDIRVDVFRSSTGGDPEADELIGTATATSTGAAQTVTVPTSQLAAGDLLRTTTTEDLGGGSHGATSELSPAATVTLAVVNSSGDAADAAPADGICDTGAPNADGDPECTLRAALDSAAASAVDGVAFAVPAGDTGNVGGVVTITPAVDLPAVTVDVDASTQSGFTGTPLVAIDGAASVGPVLDVATVDVTLRSLAVLGGAGSGVRVTADDVAITDTWVGLAPDGTTVDAPATDGIRVDGAARVRIDGGRIRGVGANGVTVVGATADDVAVTGTTIAGSSGLPIDLGDDGATANDPGDVDTGPNGLLNAPEPTIATPDEVLFDLDVPLAGDYRIELFRNPAAGGQGEELVTTTTITHAGAGAEPFTLSGLTGITEDDELTLLATEAIGGVIGSTSEFSATILADDDHADVNSTADSGDAAVGDGLCATGGTVGADDECTLRAALEEAAATSRIAEVRFAVPPADAGNVGGVVTFTPGSDLPAVAAGLVIDGTTQAGFTADPIVAIDGSGVTGAVLDLGGAATTLRSLSVHGGPSHGVSVTADDVTITDTWVGVAPDGSDDGMAGDGLRADGAARVLLDGGRVRDNAGSGVAVVGAADDVAVVDTLVARNGGLAIDLGDDGVTANDAGDGDAGPNGLLNRPVVTAMSEAAGTVTLDVDLDVPAASVLLQVFTTPTRDPSGAGEGTTLVHSQVVAGGAATRSVSFAGDLSLPFTVTATEESGGTYGSTSEFSDTATLPVAAADPGLVPEVVANAGALSSWRLGEAAGARATDAGTLGADGTVSGGATFGATGVTAADGDTALDLDGTDGVVIVPHDPGHLLAEGAVALWVRLDGLAGVQTVFSKDAAGAGDGGHAALRVLADGSVEYEQGSTSDSVVLGSAPSSVTAGTWHHLAATFGSRGVELWVDGVRVAADDTWTAGWDSSAGGATGNTEPITLGASQRASTAGTTDVLDRYVDGRLDEVALFGAQVPGATIAALAGAAPQGIWTTPAGTLLTIPAAQGVLANDHDRDGEALTATLVSAPASAASFALVGDGSFTYTPVAGFTGTDTFTYTVTDGIGTSAVQTATVTVLPTQGDPVITDSSGNGHAGRARGGMTSGDEVAGRIGTALDLDGSDDRVAIPNLDVAGSEITLSAWLEADAFGTDPVLLAKAVGVADADTQWRLRLDDTAPISGILEGAVRSGGVLDGAADAGLTPVSDWVHVAVRADGTTLTLFVDGTAVATAPQTTGSLPVDPRIEAGIGGVASGGAPFDGRVDEVRVSSTARSDAWLAAEHATQDAPAAAVTVGSTQTGASPGWTTSTAQARSGSASALAPSGVLRSWLTLDGIAETGLEARAWWRVNQLSGIDLGQGVRAGDAGAGGPVQQDEVGLSGAAGWDLGQVFGTRTQLLAPPAGQTPTVDTWQRVVVRIDQTIGLSATADGADVPSAGSTFAGVAPTGTFGLRADDLDPAARWWIDDIAIRRFVSPEPIATVRRTEQAP